MRREIIINGQVINDLSDCYVIAEVGHNHQGKVETAKQMFAAAKEAGAHAVKLQKRHNRTLFTKALYHKPYDSENAFGATYGEHREALEFGKAEYQELIAYCTERQIAFFATAFDFASADFLAGLNMPAYKIASGDLRNVPLLKYVAQIGKPMIISTGGALIEDVQRAHDAIMPINKQLCILQCTAAYPVNWEEIDLLVIDTFRRTFPDVVVGLSAHDNGIAMAVAAYMLGARVVEKHFTLNRTMKGTDHAFSLEPLGMKKMVRDLQRLRVALGDGRKKVYPSEHAPLVKMSKAVVAARPLPAGHVLTADDLAFRSPGGGLYPYQVDLLLEKVLLRPLGEEEMVRLEDVAAASGRAAA
jgi:sialic acid synthase